MNIVIVRRIAQIFFFVLFLWLCVVSTVGDHWFQLRGWPVDWLLQLDPLVALGTLLTTKTLYAGLLWALLTVSLTILFGRFFCGWICPFGTLHQFVGWLGRRRKKHAERVAMNQYRSGQTIKYYILIALLGAASGGLIAELIRLPGQKPVFVTLLLIAGTAILGGLVIGKVTRNFKQTALGFLLLAGAWCAAGFLFRPENIAASSLQTGLLDPIPLMHRSVNLVLLTAANGLSTASRYYIGAWAIAAVFMAAVLLNLWIPRFYCRFICPLGALFGTLVRWTPWRIGKRQGECSGCELCENNCEGACDPFGKIRTSECLLCMNCLRACRQAQMRYGPHRSAAGEIESPGLKRRGFLWRQFQAWRPCQRMRLMGLLDQNWNSAVVRPPGALTESEFLDRCIKCGQCMRACPTNVVQPTLLQAGLEGHLDAGVKLPRRNQRLPAQLHRLRSGLSHRGHPPAVIG